MQRRFVLLALASAALFILPQSAYAQEAQPGDACTTNGAVRSTGGPEQMPRRMLICNGTTWQSALEQTTAGASLLQIGNDTGSCTTAKLGRMRYNGTSTWDYCNGTSWATLGGGGSAAGANREIQFNSGGAFATDPTFTLTSDGVLVVGTNELDPMNGSVALGSDATASAWASVGLGENVIASGTNSFASGLYTRSSNDLSTAMGGYTRAAGYASFAIGEQIHATGDYSMAFGRTAMAGDGITDGTTPFAATNPGIGENAVSFGLGFVNIQANWPRTTGDSSFGIFMGAQTGVNLSTANTMGLFGGKMVIDPAIPATNLSADTALEIAGTLKIGSGGEACDASREGSIRYLAASDTFETCATAGSWTALGGGGGSAAGADREIQFNSGGVFGASSTFKLMADGDLLLTGTHTDTASAPASGAGTRMFFDTQMSAFRAGRVYGTEWDSGSIGAHSVAMGSETTASGLGSVAFGSYNTASGMNSFVMGNVSSASASYAVAMGQGAIASGNYSIALGTSLTASGIHSLALGYNTKATGADSLSMGANVTAGNGTVGSGQGDGSMAIGLIDDAVTITTPSQVTGIQSMGIFMGDQDGLVVSANNQMSLLGGKMVIDSTIPATNLVADTELEIDGTLKIGNGGEACDANREGSIRYIAASDTFEACATAGSWSALGGGASLSGLTAATATNTIANANFTQTWNWDTLTTGNGLVLNSTSLTDGNILRVINSNTTGTGGPIYAQTSSTGALSYGVGGFATSTTGLSIGLYGSSTSSSGNGVRGSAGSGTGTTSGVYGSASSTSGRGVYGWAAAATGTTYGVYGQANSTAGHGVYGTTTAATGTTYGVYGTSASSAGYGGYFTNTSTGVALRAQGDLEYTGSLRDMSDIRLKDNVKPLDSALDKITQLQGISFTMKDSKTGDTEYGFSAQDVQKIYPDLVHQAPDENGTLSMNYTGLIAPLVEAIKEQQKEIEALKAEIEALKAQE